MPIPPQLLLQFLPMLLSMFGGGAGGVGGGAGGSPAFMQGMMQGAIPLTYGMAKDAGVPGPLRMSLPGAAFGLAKSFTGK